ncbi:uncharacterized protein EDB93DRAFT_1164810, partial [Suillus bovinus]|uniref:uncharacterized protein n=1 Tax=Suillus bovinus TaxID=48563 RepID=UPI001B882486
HAGHGNFSRSFVSSLSLPKITIIVVLHPTLCGTWTCAGRSIHDSSHPNPGNCRKFCKMHCASRSLLPKHLGILPTCGMAII